MILQSTEEQRLHTVERLRLLDSVDDSAFDALVRQAATLCAVPAALLTIVAHNDVWIKASCGSSFERVQPRERTLCSRVVESRQFYSGTVRRDDTHLKFYAGTPVFVAGACIGALCVLDVGDREVTINDRKTLEAIASAIGGILEERLRLASAPDPDLVEIGLGFTDNAWMLFALKPGDPMPRIEYANARALQIIGLSLAELTTNPRRFYEGPGYADAVLLAIERAQTGDESPAQVEIMSPQGMRWLAGRARRLSDGRDGSMRFMTIARDITEQKRAEAFRDLLAEAIRQTPEAVLIVKMTGEELSQEIVYANEAFFALTGYRASEYPNILGDDSDKGAVLHAVRAILEGRATEGETLLYRRDGSTFLGQWRSHPIDAPDRHAVIIIEDVTAQRAQQRRIAMLSAAVDQAEDFVSVVDDTPIEEGGPLVIYTNRAVQRASGYSGEELLGKPYNYLTSPNNPEKMGDAVRASISAGKPGYRELLMRRKDGTDFWIEMVGRTFNDPATDRAFRVSVGRDITLRRRAFNQTALLLEASDQSSDAIVLYEPNKDGALMPTYENRVSERSRKNRLLALWNEDSKIAQRIRAALESGGEVREVFAEDDADGSPALVQFSARAVRNDARLEAIVTIERVIAKADHALEETGQSLLLRVVGMLPALVHAQTTDERLVILRAILLDAFAAELQPSTAHLKDDGVHVSTGWKGATFKLGREAYAARWTRDLDSVALTALRLCIEATIEEERKAARP